MNPVKKIWGYIFSLIFGGFGIFLIFYIWVNQKLSDLANITNLFSYFFSGMGSYIYQIVTMELIFILLMVVFRPFILSDLEMIIKINKVYGGRGKIDYCREEQKIIDIDKKDIQKGKITFNVGTPEQITYSIPKQLKSAIHNYVWLIFGDNSIILTTLHANLSDNSNVGCGFFPHRQYYAVGEIPIEIERNDKTKKMIMYICDLSTPKIEGLVEKAKYIGLYKTSEEKASKMITPEEHRLTKNELERYKKGLAVMVEEARSLPKETKPKEGITEKLNKFIKTLAGKITIGLIVAIIVIVVLAILKA